MAGHGEARRGKVRLGRAGILNKFQGAAWLGMAWLGLVRYGGAGQGFYNYDLRAYGRSMVGGEHEMIKELDIVAILGTVVMVYEDGKSYEVEFVDADGKTRGCLTLPASLVTNLHGTELELVIESIPDVTLQSIWAIRAIVKCGTSLLYAKRKIEQMMRHRGGTYICVPVLAKLDDLKAELARAGVKATPYEERRSVNTGDKPE